MKLHNSISMVTIILISLSLSACFSGVDETNVTELEGAWFGSCRISSIDGYQANAYEFTGNKVKGNIKQTSDARCIYPVNVITAEGTFEIQDPVDLNDGQTATQYSINFESVVLTPKIDSQADYLNSINYCNVTNWEREVGIEVIDCEQYEFTKQVYNIYRREDDKLYLGDYRSGDTSSESNRPTVLESDFYRKFDGIDL